MEAFRNYLAASTLLIGFLFYYIPFRYQTPYPREIGPQFDTRIRTTYTDILNEQQPHIFLLGDSMLGPAVDEQVVAKQLGRKVSMISLPGTASTLWYLIIKNNVVIAEHKPEYLVVFFRDTMMTLPGYRVSGRYFEQIDEFAGPDDEVLIQRAYIDQMTPLEKMMEGYVPLYGSRWTIRQSIDYYIRYTLGRGMLNCNSTCMDYSMEVVFGEGNLDIKFLSEAIAAADDYLYSREVLNFDDQVGKSFLPEIIRLCKENDIQLVLVRMPILRFVDTQTQPQGLITYIQKLDEYLKESGVPFLDFDQKEIQSENFADSLHLNEKGRDTFTRKLAESLKTIIK